MSPVARERFRWVVGALVAAAFGLALLVNDAARALAHALAFAGIAAVFVPGWRRATSREDRLVYASLGLFVAASVVSLAVHPTPWGASRAGLHAMVLLAIPMAHAVRVAAPNEGTLWGGAVFGAIASGVWASIEAYRALTGGGEAAVYAKGGVGYHTLFGVAMAAYTVLALGGLGWFKARGGAWMAVPVAGAIASLVACLFSASRGAWLALLVVSALWLARAWSDSPRGRRIRIAIAAALALVVLTALPLKIVAVRVDAMVKDLQTLSTKKGSQSSLGGRFDAWRLGGMMFAAHPIAGVGVGNFKEEARALLTAEKRRGVVAASFDHPHSEIVAAAATRGILGILALFVLFAIPLRRFFTLARSGDEALRRYGTTGIAVLTSLGVWGISDSLFERTLPTLLFALTVGVLHGLARAREDALDSAAA